MMRTNDVRRWLGLRWSSLLCAVAALGPAADAQKAYVTNSASGNVSVIDTLTSTVVGTIPVGTTPGRLALSADGKRAYVPDQGSDDVTVVSTCTDSVVQTIAVGDGPAIAAVSPDGRRLYVGGANGLISVIDTQLGAQVSAIVAGAPASGSVSGLAVAPDGSRVYALWGDLVVIDAATETVTGVVYAGNTAMGLAVTPDGSRIYVPDAFGYGAFNFYGSVTVLDASSLSVTSVINVWGVPDSIAISPDGTRSCVSTPYTFVNTGYGMGYITAPWVMRLDLTTDTLSSGANAGAPAGAVAFTPDGSRAFATVPRETRVAVIDVASNTVVASIGVGTAPNGVAIAPGIEKRSARTPGAGMRHP